MWCFQIIVNVDEVGAALFEQVPFRDAMKVLVEEGGVGP